jgi:hypothetical protein
MLFVFGGTLKTTRILVQDFPSSPLRSGICTKLQWFLLSLDRFFAGTFFLDMRQWFSGIRLPEQVSLAGSYL